MSVVGLSCVSATAQAPQRGSASSSPAVEAALQKGEAALKAKQFKDALSAFKRAGDLQKQESAAAFYGISRAYRGLGDYKREQQAAIDGINIAVTRPDPESELAARLYNQLGLAMTSQATKPSDEAMRDAGEAFYTALTLSRSVPNAMFNLGVVLLQRGLDDAGLEALEEYRQLAPQTAEAELAKKYIANPQLARDAFRRADRGLVGGGAGPR